MSAATLKREGNAVIVEGSVRCNDAEYGRYPDPRCAVPAKYRVSYQKGKVIVKAL